MSASYLRKWDYNEVYEYKGREIKIYKGCTGLWQAFIDNEYTTAGVDTKWQAKAQLDQWEEK